jgi:hypothetical protein
MFCPNLSDPKIKEQFGKLEKALPDFAYYLWDKYQGEVPAKYYETPEAVAQRMIQEDIKSEKVKDLITDLRKDTNYQSLEPKQQAKYISSQIFKREIVPLQRRKSVSVEPNGDIIFTPTERVTRGNRYKSAQDNFKGYAYSVANNLNRTYFSTSAPAVAKLTELPDGRLKLELLNNNVYFDNLVRFINEVEEEFIAAEIEAIERAEFLAQEHQSFLDRSREANEMVVAGEIYPYDGSLLDSRLGVLYKTANPQYEKYSKVLNFLGTKFKGASWSWNVNLSQAARVNLLTGEIEFNPYMMQDDTPWHEFGHFTVRAIKDKNPELFNELKEEVKKLHEEDPANSAFSYVRELYPEYGLTEAFWEEAITTELGRQAALENKQRESLTIFEKIKNFFRSLFGIEVNDKTSMSSLVDELLSKEEVELINDYYSPEFAQVMYQRAVPEDLEESMSSIIKEDLLKDDQGNFLEFGEQVRKLASQIEEKDFKQILNSNKFIGTPNDLLNASMNQLKRIQKFINKEEVAASFLELTEYVQRTNSYLKQVEAKLREIEDNEEYDGKKKLAALHFAKKQTYAFEAQVNQILALLNKDSVRSIKAVDIEQQKKRSENGLLYQLAAIKGTINNIKEEHESRIIQPVTDELWTSIEAGNREIAEQYDREIERLRKGKSNKRDELVKKKIEEKERRVLTKEKLAKILTEGDTTGAYLAESAFKTKNPTVQSITGYIKQGLGEVNSNQLEARNELQSIQDEIAEEQGDVAGVVVDLQRVYKDYTREVDYVYVEGGELKTKTVLALNTKTRTVELQNEITTLKYNLENAKSVEERQIAQDKVDEFYEKYTERPFTEEYYEIQDRLPLRIRKKRQDLYQQITEARQLLETSSELDEDGTLVIERIQSLNREIDDMERLYDEKGNKKTGQDLEDAQAIIQWKKDKKAKNMVSYELTESSKAAFSSEYNRRLSILQVSLKQATTEEEREAAQNAFDAWASINVRTTYKQEFYDRRAEVLNEISYLLSDRKSADLNELYEELFNILKGSRDSSGVYIPSNYSKELLSRAKVVEEQIESVKDLLKESSPLDASVKEQLKGLMKELQELQSTAVSSYYTETKERILSEIRTQTILENPNVDEAELNRLVNREFINSDWYKENHVTKRRYNPELQTVENVMEPTFVWRVTRPNNPDYVEKNQAGFNWYTARVNEDFINSKYKSGSVQFKEQTSGTYYNQNYDTLSPKKKAILEKLRKFYYNQQEGLYARDKLGDVIPGLRKSSAERFIDAALFRKNPFAGFLENIKAFWKSDTRDVEDEADSYGTQDTEFGLAEDNRSNTRGARRLFMKHSTPLDIGRQSPNIMAAIASYSEASAKFKGIRSMQSVILSAEEIVADKANKKSIISRAIDRNFYGKTLSGGDQKGAIGTAYRIMNSLGRLFMGAAGSKVIKFNAMSIVPNYTTGIKNNFANARSHGLSQREMAKAFYEASRASKDWVISHSTYGNRTLQIQLLDFFATEQKEYFEQGRGITNKGFRKYGQIHEVINTTRDLTEFMISAQNAFAYLGKYTVKETSTGKQIPLKNAFILKDGTITQRDDVEIPEGLIQLIKNKIYLANRRSQGVYDTMSQPELSTEMWFRFLIFLKKWVGSDLKSSFGSETIHYGTGLRTEGSWRAFISLLRDSAVNYNGNFIAAYNEASEARKGGVVKTGVNLTVFLALVNALQALVKYSNCEEDGEADAMDYLCYFMKRIINEAEGISTAWGLNELVFTYYKEKANGVTLADKAFGQLTSPVTIFRRFQTDEEFFTMDPYYRYNKSKISWDKTHPGLAGEAGLMVMGYELFGLRGLMLDAQSMEFNNRRFNDYAPKTYTKELATRYKANYEGVELMKQRTPAYQLRRQYRKQLNKLKEQARRAREANNESLYNELVEESKILKANANKRLQEIRERNNEFEEIQLPYIPFLNNRTGLDLSAGEIDQDDLE